MRIERSPRRRPIALGSLRQREVERGTRIARIERQHIGERLARRGEPAGLQIALAKHGAIAGIARLKRNRGFGEADGIIALLFCKRLGRLGRQIGSLRLRLAFAPRARRREPVAVRAADHRAAEQQGRKAEGRSDTTVHRIIPPDSSAAAPGSSSPARPARAAMTEIRRAPRSRDAARSDRTGRSPVAAAGGDRHRGAA